MHKSKNLILSHKIFYQFYNHILYKYKNRKYIASEERVNIFDENSFYGDIEII